MVARVRHHVTLPLVLLIGDIHYHVLNRPVAVKHYADNLVAKGQGSRIADDLSCFLGQVADGDDVQSGSH